ncbi:UNVERIFIED_ORG: hypothetical protein QOE_4360 [Clostridioides difficile F501]
MHGARQRKTLTSRPRGTSLDDVLGLLAHGMGSPDKSKMRLSF